MNINELIAQFVQVNSNLSNSNFICGGSFAVAVTQVNENITLGADHYVVLVDATNGDRFVYLPDARTCRGRHYLIGKIDSSAYSVTIFPYPGQYILGESSVTFFQQFQNLEIVSDGMNWLKLRAEGTVGGSPTPYFTINLVPTSISSPPNSSTNLTLTITPYNNFTGTVNLSLSGAPSGVSISPTSVNVPGSNPVVSTITLTIGNVAPNTYNIIFNAISGSINRYANLSLTVQQYGLGSNYGYVCGEYGIGGGISAAIDRFQFPFNSGTANRVGNLSGGRYRLSANNSSTYGYVCGGRVGSDYDDVVSTIDRFQFPFDSGTASHVGNLSGKREFLSATDGVDFVTMFV